jgi:hypothetical protein
MDDSQIQPAAEFQALPLEFIIASPLIGAVKAQSMAASTTIAFLNSFKNDTVEFAYKTQQTGGKGVSTTVKAPLLSLVPVPHLKIDSLTVNFKYEITQVVKSTKDKSMDAGLEVGTTGLLSKFISGTLKGNVSSKSSDESVMNRSGVLEITMHASESPMPEGLAKILNLLAKSIDPPAEK